MQTKLRETYKCDHCGKWYLSKHFAVRHELMCKRDPENFRPCFDCEHLTKKETEIWIGIDDYHTGEPIYEKKEFLFCSAKSHFIYTPINELKGNFNHYDNEGGHLENKPMPKECDMQKNLWTKDKDLPIFYGER